MRDMAIRAESLSKVYRIGAKQERYKTLRDTLVDAAMGPVRRVRRLLSGSAAAPPSERFLALDDVSFEIGAGEVVGVIGRNGAGKSTLLKVLSRITEPTTGFVDIYGRVGSLLEVGTGFHPELTGRENIYLSGALLGMKRAEITRKLDEIVDFSEVERFIDTPVKHYSSGMYLRLAFAVAAHLEPEILLIDEVLAVGDVAFQKKCLGKMGDVAEKGRTVLFVSHNMGAVARLCKRSILLAKGALVKDGPSDEVISAYLMESAGASCRRVVLDRKVGDPVAIREVAVTSPGKADSVALDVLDDISVEIRYDVHQDMKGTNLGCALKRDGVMLFQSWDIDDDVATLELRPKGDYLSRMVLPQRLLKPGTYSISIAFGRPRIGAIVQYEDCLSFAVENLSVDSSFKSLSRGGLLAIPVRWETARGGSV